MENGIYLISRCLLGENCKYNGGNNKCPNVIKFYEEHNCLSVCPECAGGLPVPRVPSEQVQGSDGTISVITADGDDVTEEFRRGAVRSLQEARDFSEEQGLPIVGAILKANSPSCGVGVVYDGSFTGGKVLRDGIFAALLIQNGISVATEDDYEEMFK